MRLGVNLPYTDRPWPEGTWRQLARFKPQQVVVTSFAARADLERLVAEHPDLAVYVRPRTGPQHQPWPSEILDYRSWDTERNLGECLETLSALVPPGRLYWVGGNEPTIEWAPPIDWSDTAASLAAQADAARAYADWWHHNAAAVKRAFPHVLIAVAPLSEGWPELEWQWFRALREAGCYDRADFLADHCYFAGQPFEDLGWGSRFLALQRFLPALGAAHILETDDDGRLVGRPDRHLVYAAYTGYVSKQGAACLSLFTLAGAPDDGEKPSWWFLGDGTLDACRDAMVIVVPPLPQERTMTEYEQFLRAEAARRGIDPDVAARVARAEGGLDEAAKAGDNGSSFWALQLHYGGAGYEHLHPTPGLGNDFTARTGWQPGDPAAWRDAMRYALDRVKWWGWGPFHGAKAVGVGEWDGIDRQFLWEVTPDQEWDYRAKATPPAPSPADPPVSPPSPAPDRGNHRNGLPVVERLSPNFGGPRGMTRGIVVHTTRGGTPDAETDYRATINWFLNPASEVSAHVVVGPSEVSRMVPDHLVAWHAGELNETYLGIEFAQPTAETPLSEAQYQAGAAIVADWCLRYEIEIPPIRVLSTVDRGIIGHEDTAQGKAAGKTDPGPRFEWARFITLVRDLLRAPSPPATREQDLETILGYLTGDLAAALARDLATVRQQVRAARENLERASWAIDAVQAAVDQLARHRPS